MEKKEVEKKTGIKKFDIICANTNTIPHKWDICIQNPPYGSVGGDTLHLKFVDKILEIANKQVVIMPLGFVTKTTKSFEKYKDKFSKRLISVEEVDTDTFEGVVITNGTTAIYNFGENDTDIINININKQKYTVNNIKEISNTKFTEYENNIIKYLNDYSRQPSFNGGGAWFRKKEVIGKTKDEIEKYKINNVINDLKKIKDFSEKNKKYNVFLLANSHGAYPYANFIVRKAGQIFNSYNDLEKYLISEKKSSGFVILIFKSYKEAENCLNALKRPLLRFTLYRLQEDHNLFAHKHYKYVPKIDWEDDRAKTDEGILELCGCPKDKCKEYVEYCKNIIDNVDK